jgi:hypothetical protein
MVSIAPCPAGLFLDPRERALTNLDFSQGAKDANSCRGKPKPLMLRHSRSEWRGLDPAPQPGKQRCGMLPAHKLRLAFEDEGRKARRRDIYCPIGLGPGEAAVTRSHPPCMMRERA